MNTFAILALAAATVGSGWGYDKPGVGGKKLLRPHVVANGAAPAGGMIQPPIGGAGLGAQAGRRFPNTRSQVFFLDPAKMTVGWQSGGAGEQRVFLTHDQPVPFRYNFNQGFIYRLKLTNIPNHPEVALFPTIEVAPSTPATDAYLTHNPIPLQFTAEDFEQVIDGGNFVTKVIYLPDPKYQELAIAGVETLVSTRLEPGVDPILEADKRGTILMIVRLGGINLEMNNNVGVTSGPMTGGMAPGTTTVLPPGTLPPGVVESTPFNNVQPNLPAEAPAVDSVAPIAPAPVIPAAPDVPAPPAPAPPAGDTSALIPPAPALPSPELPIPVPAPTSGN